MWGPLTHNRVRQVLHNPRYAGAFCFGRSRLRTTGDGRCQVDRLPREQWRVLLPGTHPGYLTWDEYEENLRRLRANAQTYGAERRAGPPREGPALLQGLVLCARCGERMTVRYHRRDQRLLPTYLCQRAGVEHGQPICQQVAGAALDAAVGELLIGALTPLALEVTLALQQELQVRAAEADRLRQQQVERARHEAELAQYRYLRVHPDNRLVADALEADWNAKLRALTEAQDAYERQRAAAQAVFDAEQSTAIRSLATEVPRLWRDPATPDRERKRLVRLLVEDVTLLKGNHLTAHVRFRGGATRTLTLPLPLTAWQARQTDSAVVHEIDRLLDEHTDGEVAALFNARGLHSGTHHPFTPRLVGNIRRAYQLPDRFSRLRARGLLTLPEMAAQLAVCPTSVKSWRARGLLRAHPYNDKGACLYESPAVQLPRKGVWKRRPTTPGCLLKTPAGTSR